MKKGNDSPVQGSKDWKSTYLGCYSDCTMSEARRAKMRAAILSERIRDVDIAAHAVVRPERSSLLSRLHRSGVGYIAAAAAVFVVYSVGSRPGVPSTRSSSAAMDDSVLRYARLLPADFDLEGDPGALPNVVSEVVGAPAASSPKYEMNLPARLQKAYVPREGRFFSAPGGKLGVAVQLRPPRPGAGAAKPKTLYMMPSSPDVDEVMPQNGAGLARYVNMGADNPPVSFDDEPRSVWKSGNLNYVLLDQ